MHSQLGRIPPLWLSKVDTIYIQQKKAFCPKPYDLGYIYEANHKRNERKNHKNHQKFTHLHFNFAEVYKSFHWS